MNSKLVGKVAVVTGGARGIGRAFAQRLIEDGAAVIIADLDESTEAAAEFRARGGRAVGVPTDVGSEESVNRLAHTAGQEFGKIDILVNNAALFSSLKPSSFEDISAKEWMQVMKVNTLGPFLCARAVMPLMRKTASGRIINVASNTVHKGVPGLLHYVSSKGAIISFTRALARELGSSGITVNALAPGLTLSSGVESNPAYTPVFRSAANQARSLQRDQRPDDLVGALSFLASDDAAFITGQTLIVDGGNVFV